MADALLDLIEEGELRPTSKNIAERAGVSERTIFQHFEDLESLFCVAASRVGERILRNMKEIPVEGLFEARLQAYLDEIAYLNETMTPVRRASRLHEPFSPVVDRALCRLRSKLRRGIERVFARELAGYAQQDLGNALEALAVVVSWSSWENMRRNSRLSPEQARAVLELCFRSILRVSSSAEPAASA